MLMSFISHILCAWFAFLLPSYATFKAISHRPLNEPELERWAMYWSVVGSFVATEYFAEWLICWLPFYWEAKTLFLLYLALPQTQASTHNYTKQYHSYPNSPSAKQGSTYIYQVYLYPFFTQHEAELDEGIIKIQKKVLTLVQTRITAIWEFILNAANKRQVTSPANPANSAPTAPAGSPLQSAYGLWQNYAPSIMNVLGSSSTSVKTSSTAATQRRTNGNGSNSSSATSASPNPKPAFPEPELFS